jgi:hypothetical protein
VNEIDMERRSWFMLGMACGLFVAIVTLKGALG